MPGPSRLEKELKKKLGEILRAEREKRHWSQGEVSPDVSQGHLSDIERGIRAPGLFLFLSIAEGLRIPVGDLLGKLGIEDELICSCSSAIPADQDERDLIERVLEIVRSDREPQSTVLKWVLSVHQDNPGAELALRVAEDPPAYAPRRRAIAGKAGEKRRERK